MPNNPTCINIPNTLSLSGPLLMSSKCSNIVLKVRIEDFPRKCMHGLFFINLLCNIKIENPGHSKKIPTMVLGLTTKSTITQKFAFKMLYIQGHTFNILIGTHSLCYLVSLVNVTKFYLLSKTFG